MQLSKCWDLGRLWTLPVANTQYFCCSTSSASKLQFPLMKWWNKACRWPHCSEFYTGTETTLRKLPLSQLFRRRLDNIVSQLITQWRTRTSSKKLTRLFPTWLLTKWIRNSIQQALDCHGKRKSGRLYWDDIFYVVIEENLFGLNEKRLYWKCIFLKSELQFVASGGKECFD